MRLGAVFSAKLWLILATFLVLQFCSGCILVPFINGIKELGITESDRIRLFDKAISEFHDYQRMQLISQMAGFVVPEWRQNFMNIYRQRKNSEKVIDYAIEMVEFNEDVDEATAEVAVRRFQNNRYVVETRIEKQIWVFISGGWKLKELEVLQEAGQEPVQKLAPR
jgi:hypothetical protein